ncbi:hypothetical protein HanXRQr2_Chr02g0050711 [Helianthus annuus]|uniref:Uncharacterized protein n=1 Tax=Helianthus annuus TaxID=4232 RepID=A0A9K3NYJ8_HELAN|nr:hypothetical protein HanXRQr2_Chr02g0050711 [Helianthus annuus]
MMLKYLQPHDHIIILAYTFAYIYFHISYTFALNYHDSSTSNTRRALHHSSTRYKLLMHNFTKPYIQSEFSYGLHLKHT